MASVGKETFVELENDMLMSNPKLGDSLPRTRSKIARSRSRAMSPWPEPWPRVSRRFPRRRMILAHVCITSACR
jgi:hypothetical protein